jgi:hypothetical protein
MAAQFSPPYDIAVHPKYRDEPFDELPKWLQNRIERYSVATEDVDEDVDDSDDNLDESGDPMPEGVEFPHHKGGGYYVLSDGSIVRGQDDAEKAQAKL